MIRRLIVMRHAKSDWHTESQTDHDRPLNDRGRRDAPLVARKLSDLDVVPQYVLSSDSLRTRETCGLMMQEWEDGIETEFLSSLYHAGIDAVRNELPRVSDEVEVLFVLGHNPGWEHLVFKLTGEPVTMKTATAVVIEADCESWNETIQTSWSIVEIIYPRELA